MWPARQRQQLAACATALLPADSVPRAADGEALAQYSTEELYALLAGGEAPSCSKQWGT